MSWAVCVLWGVFFNLLCLYFALERSVLIHLTVLQGYVHIDWSVPQDPQASSTIGFIITVFILFLFLRTECFDWWNISDYNHCQCISKWWEKHSPWSNTGNFVNADEASHEDKSLTADLAVKECLWKGRHAISTISSPKKQAYTELTVRNAYALWGG